MGGPVDEQKGVCLGRSLKAEYSVLVVLAGRKEIFHTALKVLHQQRTMSQLRRSPFLPVFDRGLMDTQNLGQSVVRLGPFIHERNQLFSELQKITSKPH